MTVAWSGSENWWQTVNRKEATNLPYAGIQGTAVRATHRRAGLPASDTDFPSGSVADELSCPGLIREVSA